MYDSNEVMNPNFRLVSDKVDGVSCRDVYLQTFVFNGENGDWDSADDSEWHHLARIFPELLITFPIHTNPHAMRYLTPRHGRIKTITYELGGPYALPESIDIALSLIQTNLSSRVCNDYSFGLGLVKELEPLIAVLKRIPNIDTIFLTKNGTPKIDGNCVYIPEWHLGDMRRLFDKGTRKFRERLRTAKRWYVQNEFLPEIDPEKFPRLVSVNDDAKLVEHKIVREKPSISAARAGRYESVRAVKQNAEQLAKEAPGELVELHSEIERATLSAMIDQYEKMMQNQLSEDRWQKFFEQNAFILSLVFARPIMLIHTQFHAQGSKLDGSGAQVGDFLLKELGLSLAIIEIKKPSSPLMLSSAYRNTQVFGPHSELSGAVTQVLFQKTQLHSNWLVHQSSLKESLPDATKCVVIAGITPSVPESQRCFEIFRNACKDVEVVTFDELLNKLKLMLQYLTPKRKDSQIAEVDLF